MSTNNENNFHYHNYMSIQNEIKENKQITNLKYLTINNIKKEIFENQKTKYRKCREKQSVRDYSP